jgi:hypothetical protein
MRRLSDRKGVAVRVLEIGDLGFSLERGDALLARDDRDPDKGRIFRDLREDEAQRVRW